MEFLRSLQEFKITLTGAPALTLAVFLVTTFLTVAIGTIGMLLKRI